MGPPWRTSAPRHLSVAPPCSSVRRGPRRPAWWPSTAGRHGERCACVPDGGRLREEEVGGRASSAAGRLRVSRSTRAARRPHRRPHRDTTTDSAAPGSGISILYPGRVRPPRFMRGPTWRWRGRCCRPVSTPAKSSSTAAATRHSLNGLDGQPQANPEEADRADGRPAGRR
ncbi:hypothetical protein ACRAWF_16055 [Streptomyces sp. L7]